MKKNSCMPINPKKYSCYGLKKNSYKDFDNEKKFLQRKNSPPPYNFSNGLSLKFPINKLEVVLLEKNLGRPITLNGNSILVQVSVLTS